MINVTDKALEKLKALIGEHKSKGILITVESGGCSGIDYSLSYEMEIPENIGSVEIQGITFFYDPMMELMINGVEIDLVENSFGHGFVVTNKKNVPCQNCSCNCKE